MENSTEFQKRHAEDVDFKIVREKCWGGKPLILELFTEVKAVFGTCVGNSGALVQFTENFIEKTFDFLCNIEKNYLVDENGKEQPRCEPQHGLKYEKCLFKYHPNGFNFGICE